MIPYINDRMNRWADWRMRGRFHSGLGYPSAAAFLRLAPSEYGSRVPVLDEECFEVENAFIALLCENQCLAEVLFLFHCRGSGMTVAQMARECRCCRDTFYSRVTRGHQAIMGYLNDLAAGMPLPRPAIAA